MGKQKDIDKGIAAIKKLKSSLMPESYDALIKIYKDKQKDLNIEIMESAGGLGEMLGEGGRIGMMYGGDPGFAFSYGGSWADWKDNHASEMPLMDYINQKLPKARNPFSNGGEVPLSWEEIFKKQMQGQPLTEEERKILGQVPTEDKAEGGRIGFADGDEVFDPLEGAFDDILEEIKKQRRKRKAEELKDIKNWDPQNPTYHASGGRIGLANGTTMDLKYINPGFDTSEGMLSGVGGFPLIPTATAGAGIFALSQKDKDKKTPQKTGGPNFPQPKPPFKIGDSIIDFIVANRRQPKPSEEGRLKEMIRVAKEKAEGITSLFNENLHGLNTQRFVESAQDTSQKLLEDLVDVEEINWDPKTGKSISTWKKYKRSDKDRPPTEEEIEDYMQDLHHGGELDWYDFGRTVAELEDSVKEAKAYEEQMRRDYYSGALDKYVKPEELEEQRLFRQKKIDKVLAKAYEEVFYQKPATGDYKYDADTLADSIAEQLGKEPFDEMPVTYQRQIYDSALKRVQQDLSMKKDLKKIEQKMKVSDSNAYLETLDKRIMDEMDLTKSEMSNMSSTALDDLRRNADPIGMRKHFDEITEGRGVGDFADDPNFMKDDYAQTEILEEFDVKDRKKNAEGGRIEDDEFREFLEDRKNRKKDNFQRKFFEDFKRWKRWKKGNIMEVKDGGRIWRPKSAPKLTTTIPPEKGPTPQGLTYLLGDDIVQNIG